MRYRNSGVIVWAVATFALPGAVGARGGNQDPVGTAPRSTLTGVYTPAQANRGEATYMSACAGCHSAKTYASPGFTRDWSGHRMVELFDYLQSAMPKNDPGSLTAKENAQVIAYLLKINRVPAGKAELSTENSVLQSTVIEFPPAGGQRLATSGR